MEKMTYKSQNPVECKDASISIVDISKRFGKIQALNGISLEIKEGTVCALLVLMARARLPW